MRVKIQNNIKDYKLQVTKKWEKHIEYIQRLRKEQNPDWQNDTTNFEGIIKFMWADDTFDNKFNEFLWTTKEFDNIRSNDAYAVYPELEQLKQYEIMPDDPRYKIA